MIQWRRAEERGYADRGWLQSWHTFSFAEYHDPAHMGFSVLRVINDDVIAPDAGFGMHSHHDMEIITYVLQGTLRHRDSLGNEAEITAGEVQRMSAGTGIRHSEFNASASTPVHLLQIWLLPERRGITPGYEQKRLIPAEMRGRWLPVATPDGRGGALTLHQDASLYATRLADGEQIDYPGSPGRVQYLHVARGNLVLNGEMLSPGDGAAVSVAETLTLIARGDGEALLFDMPAPPQSIA
jgi:redox-sensitive bicupin YhaK (pirin superfamily)